MHINKAFVNSSKPIELSVLLSYLIVFDQQNKNSLSTGLLGMQNTNALTYQEWKKRSESKLTPSQMVGYVHTMYATSSTRSNLLPIWFWHSSFSSGPATSKTRLLIGFLSVSVSLVGFTMASIVKVVISPVLQAAKSKHQSKSTVLTSTSRIF